MINFDFQLYNAVHQTALAIGRLLYGLTLPTDDPLLLAHTDLMHWMTYYRAGKATYWEGFRLHQVALAQLDVERLLNDVFGADEGSKAA